jgi:hypothetical protein
MKETKRISKTNLLYIRGSHREVRFDLEDMVSPCRLAGRGMRVRPAGISRNGLL